MAKQKYYRQCELQSGSHSTVGWIEEEHAYIGSKVHLLENGDDDRVWKVKTASLVKMPEAIAKDRERLFTRHRAHSDI